MLALDEMAKYVTTADAAAMLDVPESRFRASWRQNGIVRPALSKGLQQFERQDIVRAAALVCLQRILGEQSTLAVDLAKSLTREQLDQLLVSEHPVLDVTLSGRTFEIVLDPDYFERVRGGIARVRR